MIGSPLTRSNRGRRNIVLVLVLVFATSCPFFLPAPFTVSITTDPGQGPVPLTVACSGNVQPHPGYRIAASARSTSKEDDSSELSKSGRRISQGTIEVVKQEWDFGDGQTATKGAAGGTVQHTYERPGDYTVTLSVQARVTDSHGERTAICQSRQFITAIDSGNPAEATVPNVVGLTRSAAEQAISAANLNTGTVTEAYSSIVATGHVISQTPQGGVKVPLGTNVNLVVSLGPPPMINVPDVVDELQADAETAITGAGLAIGAVTSQHSGTVAADHVISQNPTAGTSVGLGTAVDLVISLGPEANLPPDPSDVASDVDDTLPSDIFTTTEFLYKGIDPIQTGVSPAAINPKRVAIVRGTVYDGTGTPMPGVTVTILNHDEYGQTLSREDGMYDLAVNGGGQLTLEFEKPGYLTAQRQIAVPWRDFVFAPDAALIPVDPQVTVIDFSEPVEVARGSVISDADGTRQATILFPQTAKARMKLRGGIRKDLTSLTVRATEFTVGENGPMAMPADLPPTTGYTYCVELSADEALNAKAVEVQFAEPVYFYIENFLDFPVGGAVPTGYYDREMGKWIASENGRIVKVVSVANNLAELDTDGDDIVDNDPALGITDAERARVAELYPSGQTLWRVPIEHFTPWDHNWPFGPPPGARGPDVQPPPRPLTDDGCDWTGSTVDVHRQTLGEDIPLTGTPFTLHYQSDRMPGHKALTTVLIPVSGDSIPASVKRIELEIVVAGRRFRDSLPPTANQVFEFNWDGNDAYGRRLTGAQVVYIKIGYVYEPSYYSPGTFTAAFGQLSDQPGVSITGNRQENEVTVWLAVTYDILLADVLGQKFGGWTLDVHHLYDLDSQTLYQGNGVRRGTIGIEKHVVNTSAGTGVVGSSGDGGPATEAQISSPNGLAVGPDGSIYFSDYAVHRIRRIDPDGIITTIAGTGTAGFLGDGGPATQARISGASGIVVDAEGGIIFADQTNHRVRRIAPNGIINTIAGTGAYGYSGDGGPATQAQFTYPNHLALGPDGSLYIDASGNNAIRRVSPDGTISTVWFGGNYTTVIVSYIACAEDGSLYFTENYGRILNRLTPDGAIEHIAGNPGVVDPEAEGVPATSIHINTLGLTLDRAGEVFLIDGIGRRIRRISPDGIISLVAGGTGSFQYNGEGVPGTQANMDPYGLAFGQDGSLYFGDQRRIRRIESASPGYGVQEIIIPSEDAAELFVFSNTGRHLMTIDALTNGVLYEFEYDTQGLLVRVIDGDGNATTVERAADGSPQTIVAPGGQRTNLTLNAAGYLAAASNPNGDAVVLNYTPDGLLTSFRDARLNMTTFSYDDLGRLASETSAQNGTVTFDLTESLGSATVVQTTPEGRITLYHAERLPDNRILRQTSDPSGALTEMIVNVDGERQVTYPDGMIGTQISGPDPRWGMTSPITTRATFETPGGLFAELLISRTVDLADDEDPLSLLSQMDFMTINGRAFVRTYDASTRRTAFNSPAGRQFTMDYDAQGRPVSVQYDALAPITFAYDAQGRVQAQGHGGLQWTYEYDAKNRITSRTDSLGAARHYAYDDADRVTTMTLMPSGRQYGFTYDANGNLTGITMPSGVTHTQDYNPVNDQAAYAPPVGNAYAWTYNLDRQRTQTTLPSGRTIIPSFDSAGRVEALTFPEATVDFVAAAPSNGCCGDDGLAGSFTRTGGGTSQTVSFMYDGVLPTEMHWTGVAVGDYAYEYDNNFFLTGYALDGGAIRALTRDDDGMLTGHGPFTIARGGPVGMASQITDGTGALDLGYDSRGYNHSRSLTTNSQPRYAVQITRNSAGRVSQKTETINGTSHTYDYVHDLDGQLLQVFRDSVLMEDYTYDVNGNRTSSLAGNAVYDTLDRMDTFNGVDYTVDVDGFVVSRGFDTFVYSARGELLEASLDGGPDVTYAYDGLGRRVGRTTPAGTEQYLYGNPGNPFQVTAVRDTAGALSEYYYDDAGVLYAFERGGIRHYVATDLLGSPKVICDNTGAVVKLIDYDSFGVLLSDSNSTFELPFGFAGGLEDQATGLVRFGFRDYEPATGRWMARDPILFGGGQGNLYVYVQNDPVDFVDPTGLICVGGSAYAGVGAGAQVCVTDQGLAVCVEVGFGAGGGLEVDPFGGLPRDGQTFEASGGAGLGPLGLGLKFTLDDCGDAKFRPECAVGPFGCTGAVGTPVGRGSDLLDKPLSDSLKLKGVKLQGKVSGKVCRSIGF
jgi:RHS repeat-associated protein